MLIYNGEKFACLQCIRGHRSSSCYHEHRLLYLVRKRGRPQINDELRIAIVPEARNSPPHTNDTCVNGSSRDAIVLNPGQYEMQLVDSEGKKVKVLDPPIIPSTDLQLIERNDSKTSAYTVAVPKDEHGAQYRGAQPRDHHYENQQHQEEYHTHYKDQKPINGLRKTDSDNGNYAKKARLRLRTVTDIGPSKSKAPMSRKVSIPIQSPSPDDDYVFVPAGNGLYRRELRSIAALAQQNDPTIKKPDKTTGTNSGSASGCCSSSSSTTNGSTSSVSTSSGYVTNEHPETEPEAEAEAEAPDQHHVDLPTGNVLHSNEPSVLNVNDMNYSSGLGLNDLGDSYGLGLVDTPFLIAPMHMNGMLFSDIRGLDEKPWTPGPVHYNGNNNNNSDGAAVSAAPVPVSVPVHGHASSTIAPISSSLNATTVTGSRDNDRPFETKAKIEPQDQQLPQVRSGIPTHSHSHSQKLQTEQLGGETRSETRPINADPNSHDNLERWMNTFEGPNQEDEIYDIYFAASCVLPGQCDCGDECECYGCPTHNPISEPVAPAAAPPGAGSQRNIRLEPSLNGA